MATSPFRCTSCGIALNVSATSTAKKVRCGGCGSIMPVVPVVQAESIAVAVLVEDDAPEAEPELIEEPEEPGSVEERAPRSVGRRVSNPFRFLLLVLLGGYFPFLAALTLGLIGVGLGLIVWGGFGIVGPDGFAKVFGGPGIVLGVFLILTALHVLFGLTALFRKIDDKDEFEIELPEQWQEGLIRLVEDVADERGLPVPDAIRLHAVDVAHVYQDRKGRSVLVIGGMAIVALPRKALAGIVAHELGHFGAGDTALSRLAYRWHLVIDKLEQRYAGRSLHNFNPLTWALRLYHWTYILTWFANQRRQEFAADQHEIELVGKKKAAATLVLVSVFGGIKGTDLGSVAESFVSQNERLDQIFAEQVRRIQAATISIWHDALKKALKARTAWLDSHPCLKERLDAIGVSPKKALRLAVDLSGEPATTLFINWPLVEKFLTQKIVDIVRVHYFSRRDYVETVRAVMRASAR